MFQLAIDVIQENNRRLKYEGFEPYNDFIPAVNKKCDLIKCQSNTKLLNFLISWKEYINLASKHLRTLPKNVNNGITNICTAFSTWLGNENGIIKAVANLDYEIKSFEQFLAIPKCRTGVYNAFIVSLKCNLTINTNSFNKIYKDAGYTNDTNPNDHLYQFLSIEESIESIDKLTILRMLILSRAHVP